MNYLTWRRQLQWMLGMTAAREPQPWHTGVVESGAKRGRPAPRNSANRERFAGGCGDVLTSCSEQRQSIPALVITP